jgi:hypothetical protein
VTPESFWARVVKGSECWVWTGNTTRQGYGVTKTNGRRMPAHRFAALLQHGRLDPEKIVCHTCDNRLCVRGDHLVQADYAWNNQDCARKGRHSRHKSKRTHCPHGHPYSGTNLVIASNGGRTCRECRRAHSLKWYHENKTRRLR